MRLTSGSRSTNTLIYASIALALNACALRLPAFAGNDSVLTVNTALAVEAIRPQYMSASGRVKPWDEVKVDSELTGFPVISAPFRVGETVHKGEILARLDASLLRDKVTLARATLAEDEALYTDALMRQRRAQRLNKAGMLSAQDVLDIDTRAAVAQAKLSAARSQLKAEELNLRHTAIIAPFSGIISARTLKLGEVPHQGDELYRIIRRGQFQWDAELTASELSRVRPGMHAEITAAQSVVKGVVRELSPSLTFGTQTGLAYVTLSPSPSVRAGMYVNGRILLGVRPVILVPSESIVTREGSSYAVTYKAGHAYFVPVTLGQRGARTTEVLRGLTAGTRLITQGAGLLDNGAPVSLATKAK